MTTNGRREWRVIEKSNLSPSQIKQEMHWCDDWIADKPQVNYGLPTVLRLAGFVVTLLSRLEEERNA